MRNPKTEIRNPREIRSPKSERTAMRASGVGAGCLSALIGRDEFHCGPIYGPVNGSGTRWNASLPVLPRTREGALRISDLFRASEFGFRIWRRGE